MAEQESKGPNLKVYRGEVIMPGDKESHSVSVLVDEERDAVSLRFDGPVAGSSDWEGLSPRITRRLKYLEVIFKTLGLPIEGLDLIWKMNITLDHATGAGVVIARPNELKVKGEHGFTLVGASGSPSGTENYLTRLHSSSYRS
jgi:hypothetical protein